MSYQKEGAFQQLQAMQRIAGYRVTWIDGKNRRHEQYGFKTFDQAQGFANNLPLNSRPLVQPVMSGDGKR